MVIDPLFLPAVIQIVFKSQLFPDDVDQYGPVIEREGLQKPAEWTCLLLKDLPFFRSTGFLTPGNNIPEKYFC